jgi:hypothetical protein
MVAGIYTVLTAIRYRQYYKDTKKSPVVGSAGFGIYRQFLPSNITLNKKTGIYNQWLLNNNYK